MSVRRRWAIAALLLALILAVATFPMRLALGLSGATDAGITAREVRGSVWSGELVDARLGVLPLGTVRASLSPLALLGARTELAFSRADERLGALAGRCRQRHDVDVGRARHDPGRCDPVRRRHDTLR